MTWIMVTIITVIKKQVKYVNINPDFGPMSGSEDLGQLEHTFIQTSNFLTQIF